MSDPDKIEQFSKGLSAIQTGLAVAATLGIGAAARSVWQRATIAYDERFLLDLAKHEASQKRAQEIRTRAADIGEDSTESAMASLAEQLESEANRSLRYAIARVKWRNSRVRTAGQAAIMFGVLVPYVEFAYEAGIHTGTFHYHPHQGVLYASTFLFVIAAFTLTIVKSLWLDHSAKKIDQNGTNLPPTHSQGELGTGANEAVDGIDPS